MADTVVQPSLAEVAAAIGKGPALAEAKEAPAATEDTSPEVVADGMEGAPEGASPEQSEAAVPEGEDQAPEDGEAKNGRWRKTKERMRAAESRVKQLNAENEEALGHAQHFLELSEALKAENERLKARLSEYDIPEDPQSAKLAHMERELAALKAKEAAVNTRAESQAKAQEAQQIQAIRNAVEDAADSRGLSRAELAKAFMVGAQSGMTLVETADRLAALKGLGDQSRAAQAQKKANASAVSNKKAGGPSAMIDYEASPKGMLQFMRDRKKALSK